MCIDGILGAYDDDDYGCWMCPESEECRAVQRKIDSDAGKEDGMDEHVDVCSRCGLEICPGDDQLMVYTGETMWIEGKRSTAGKWTRLCASCAWRFDRMFDSYLKEVDVDD